MSSTGTRDSDDGLLYHEGKNISNDYLPLNHRSTRTPWYRRPLPWILTTALLFATNSLLLVYSATAWQYCKPSQFGNFESGFTTDLGKSVLSIRTSATGSPRLTTFLLLFRARQSGNRRPSSPFHRRTQVPQEQDHVPRL